MTRPNKKLEATLFERIAPHTHTAYGIEKTLYQGRSRFQSIELHHSPDFGKVLVLDQQLQSTSTDEFIYHESLVHPALITHEAPRRVAILGGGEGGTLREVLRHPQVEKVTMIDIDGEVVEVCRKLLPEQADGAFDDPRAELIIGDAKAWIEQRQEPLDVIISDLPDLSAGEICEPLFSKEFFTSIARLLPDDGILSLQASEGNPRRLANHLRIRENLEAVFPSVRTMSCLIPSFACLWCFAVASKTLDPGNLDAAEVDRRLAARGLDSLGYYDGETHTRLCSLPKPIRKQL